VRRHRAVRGSVRAASHPAADPIHAGHRKTFRLTREAEADISTGRSTTLRANTRWELVGTVSMGEVYRTRDEVVTVRGDGVHEGYIVVRDKTLVGFYLPVERAFCPVSQSQPLAIEP
jgi:hypothetical protein